MKTMIAIPCMDSVPVQFAQSLACLQKAGETCIQFNVGSLIYESRNKLALDALKHGAEYIMWFDSDMAFPPDTLQKMLKHMEEGREIVSGLYFRRTQPYTPVIFKKLEQDGKNTTWEGYDDYPDELFEIAGCGFGCVCMKTSVVLDILATYGTAFTPVGNTGEDVAFCVRAAACGHKIWCDPSIKLGHAGHVLITEDFFKAYRK